MGGCVAGPGRLCLALAPSLCARAWTGVCVACGSPQLRGRNLAGATPHRKLTGGTPHTHIHTPPPNTHTHTLAKKQAVQVQELEAVAHERDAMAVKLAMLEARLDETRAERGQVRAANTPQLGGPRFRQRTPALICDSPAGPVFVHRLPAACCRLGSARLGVWEVGVGAPGCVGGGGGRPRWGDGVGG